MRSLKFPIGKILVEAKNAYSILKTFIETFTLYGYGIERAEVFNQDIQTAESMPDNLKATVELKESTDRKNEVLEECFIWCNNLKLRIELAFGVKSEEYDLFPVKELHDAKRSEETMFSVMDTCIEIAAKKADPLLVFGHTPEIQTEGKGLKAELHELDEDQEMVKKQKRSTTQDRHEIYNRLYDTVNQINSIGRKVFANEPAKLVLFKSPWTKHTVTEDIEPE